MNRPQQVLEEKYAGSFERRRLEILEELVPQGRGGAALDLGCGPGVVAEMLARRGWVVTGVDLHPANVALARPRVARAITGDALSVARTLPGGAYDLIVVTELIEHLDEDDRPALLEECRRCAGPSARLLLSTPNRMSPVGLTGYYWAQKVRGRRFTAWDQTHQRIYSSFEILAALRSARWRPVAVAGYHYRGRISLPLEVSRRFPLNRFGFVLTALCEPLSLPAATLWELRAPAVERRASAPLVGGATGAVGVRRAAAGRR